MPKVHTTNKVYQKDLPDYHPAINEKLIGIELEKGKRRFARQDEAFKRNRIRTRNVRAKLINLLEKIGT